MRKFREHFHQSLKITLGRFISYLRLCTVLDFHSAIKTVVHIFSPPLIQRRDILRNLKNVAFNDIRRYLLLSRSGPYNTPAARVETVKEKGRRSVRDPGRAPKLERSGCARQGGGEGPGESYGRILFGTSIRPADGKLISGREITNGRRNTPGGNLPAVSVRLAKNRLLAPAPSIGSNIIAAITEDCRPSG